MTLVWPVSDPEQQICKINVKWGKLLYFVRKCELFSPKTVQGWIVFILTFVKLSTGGNPIN